jgi:hypothetical protein
MTDEFFHINNIYRLGNRPTSIFMEAKKVIFGGQWVLIWILWAKWSTASPHMQAKVLNESINESDLVRFDERLAEISLDRKQYMAICVRFVAILKAIGAIRADAWLMLAIVVLGWLLKKIYDNL